MKNRGCMIKTLLLTGLLVFADVNLGFTSVNLYAAETSAVPETEEIETEEFETDVNDEDVSDMVAGDDEKAPAKEVGKKNMVPVYGSDIIDGTYDIEVDSSSSMFRIVKAQLTVKEGEMSAVITLGGKGYLRLFMGTGEEAVKASETKYAEYVEDADGAYTYEVKVEALDKPLECTGFSKRKEKWYDHQIVFEANSLEADALLITLPDYDEEEKTTQVSENDTQEAVSETKMETQVQENMTQVSQIIEQERVNLADGTYQIEVTLNGGSGRAAVESPAKVTVADGMATAELVWSSSNYDYMIVNGQKYLPINTEGNSVFSIPVMCFDKEMTVTADTTAMSTPHEVEYTLIFTQGSAKVLESKGADSGMDWNLVFLILIAVITGATVALYGTSRKK